MKKVCILCPIDNIDEVRQTASKIFNYDTLKIEVSPNGQQPATYYYCYLQTTEAGLNQLLALQKYTIIEEVISPKDFLAKYNLQIIKLAN